jgi:hypothetical protein
MWKRIRYYLKKVLKREIPLSDVWYYIQGHTREKIYYSKYKWVKLLMRKHIREQFKWRLTQIDKECYSNGQCKICSCDIPALTFANKSCHKPCYPRMMSALQWEWFKMYKDS